MTKRECAETDETDAHASMLVGKAELRPDETRYRHTNNQSSTSIFGRKGNKYVQQGVGGWDKESEAAASREHVRESRADPDL